MCAAPGGKSINAALMADIGHVSSRDISGRKVSLIKENAERLAKQMIQIGKLANKEVKCVLTKMDEPLGYSVGNSLEVIEAINFLKGDMQEDLREVVLELGSYMLKLAGKGENIEENKKRILENIQNGEAYNKFKQMVQNQGGDISYLEDTNKFEKSKHILAVVANKSGYVQEINAEEIGKLSCYLGAGRINKEDKINQKAGIILNKKVGDRVEEQDFLAYICTDEEEKLEEAERKILEIYKIDEKQINRKSTIIETI